MSFCAFLGDGEQKVADEIEWMDGMVIIGQRSSKSPFDANDKRLIYTIPFAFVII